MVTFRVNEVFDIAARDGLVAVGSATGEFTGLPRLHDEESGRAVRVLGVDHLTPRTLRTGETILVVDRADAEWVKVGRTWSTGGA